MYCTYLYRIAQSRYNYTNAFDAAGGMYWCMSSVHLSICLFVTCWYCAKMDEHIMGILTLLDKPIIVFF